MYDKIIAWFVKSSADPQKISLTVRGAIEAAIPVAVIAFHFFGAESITSNSLQDVASNVASIVANTLAAIALARATYGLLRKLWVTVYGWFNPWVA